MHFFIVFNFQVALAQEVATASSLENKWLDAVYDSPPAL